MAKKINCKDGLDKKQEIEARRLRVNLENYYRETIKAYHKLYVDWYNSKEPHFADFLKKQDIVYYSAYMRITDPFKKAVVNQLIMFMGGVEPFGYYPIR